MSREPKLLEPLSTVVGGVLRVLIGLAVLFAVLSLFDTGMHLNWTGGHACVTVSTTTTSFDAPWEPLRPGAAVGWHPEYCAESPSGYQQFLTALAARPTHLLVIGGLWLLHRTLRTAEREGVHTERTVGGLRLLGWWLLAGSLLAEFVRANARAALLATLTEDQPFTVGAWLNLWNAPYLLFLTGLGLLTFARIVRAGAVMREDLEGTV
ncbi:hypothetical protein AB0J21_23775 [Streptomyces sp. NPDC049954]|uniref:hypothetical protein n=1 Tax=Streptomyces sp. NPDC049954 TaxID=3155779 RepID=UPI003448C6D2